MKDCPKCGNTVVDGSMFCTKCGAPVSTIPQKATSAKTKPANATLCPKCGLPRKQSGQFCVGCGNVLDSDVVSKINTTYTPPKSNAFLRFICVALVIIFVVTFFVQKLDDRATPQSTVVINIRFDDREGTEQWLREMEAQFAEQYPVYDFIWNHEYSTLEDTYADMVWDHSDAIADIYFFDSRNLDNLVDSGALLPLYSYRADDYSATMEAAVTSRDSGEIYGLPVSQNTWCLYYNKEVFNEKDITSLENMLAEGRVALPMMDSRAAGCFFLGAGCTIFGDSGKDVYAGFDFDNESAYAAAKKMLGVMMHSNVYITKLGADPLIDGTSDAVFATSADYQQMKDALGDNLGIAALPTFSINEETHQMTAMSSAICVGINPSSGDGTVKQDLCKEFVSFISTMDAQQRRFSIDGTIPAQQDLAGYDPIIAAEVNTMRDCTVLLLNNRQMTNYFNCMDTYIQNILDGQINVSNYKQAVELLNQQLNT